MKLEHAALWVKDLEGAKDFFIKYFGAFPNEGYHNEKTGFRSYFLSFDDGARLEIMSSPLFEESEKSVYRSGYAHVAISLGSKEAVDELSERFKADGFEILSGPRTTGDGYYESAIIGFEGNVVEITE
ncbi:MAG: VOC family protein [Oscillospiraceae bacterium]|nr:VOC family protein [Oscillospiraceae bacterium]MBQ5897688.1 VOC family protein [Oscillospiraceae bacterium]